MLATVLCEQKLQGLCLISKDSPGCWGEKIISIAYWLQNVSLINTVLNFTCFTFRRDALAHALVCISSTEPFGCFDF